MATSSRPRDDPLALTRAAVEGLVTDPGHAERHAAFETFMAYGPRTP